MNSKTCNSLDENYNLILQNDTNNLNSLKFIQWCNILSYDEIRNQYGDGQSNAIALTHLKIILPKVYMYISSRRRQCCVVNSHGQKYLLNQSHYKVVAVTSNTRKFRKIGLFIDLAGFQFWRRATKVSFINKKMCHFLEFSRWLWFYPWTNEHEKKAPEWISRISFLLGVGTKRVAVEKIESWDRRWIENVIQFVPHNSNCERAVLVNSECVQRHSAVVDIFLVRDAYERVPLPCVRSSHHSTCFEMIIWPNFCV